MIENKIIIVMKAVPSVVLIFFVLLVLAGCSVKEDRIECPCRLMLDLSGIDTSMVQSLNIHAISSDGIVFSDTLDQQDFSRTFVRDVPHIGMRISIWGIDGSGDVLQIPYGMECPPVYMCSFDADTSGEIFFKEVELYKNHCCLTVLFDGLKEMPYSLTFRGNVDGYGKDGLPSEGDFACVAYPGAEGGSQVILPRQTDSSLLLEVEDEHTSIMKTFAIGEYLVRSGYDWTAESLKDATVILDYYITGITIIVKGWDKEYSYDIIL